jgi:predicted dehydrogenase
MKIALLGASHWHVPLYVEALVAMRAEVVGVSDADPAIAGRYAATLGSRAYTDYETMLGETRPDFVFAFGRHADMPAIASRLVGEGIAFAMEKPMGRNGDEVAATLREAEGKGLFIATPFVFRYSPIIDTIARLVSAGDFGVLTNAYFRFIAGPPSRYPAANSAWLLDPEVSGGGCTINLGVHFIDFGLLLLGGDRVERVYASMSRKKYGTPVEDFSTIVLSTSGGATCTMETGYAYPSTEGDPRHIEYCLTTTTGYSEVREGVFSWSGHDGRRFSEKIVTNTDLYYPIFVGRILEDFRLGRRPAASLPEMAAAMRLVDAAYLSAREERAVRL